MPYILNQHLYMDVYDCFLLITKSSILSVTIQLIPFTLLTIPIPFSKQLLNLF